MSSTTTSRGGASNPMFPPGAEAEGDYKAMNGGYEEEGEEEIIKDVTLTETWAGNPEFVHIMTSERKSESAISRGSIGRKSTGSTSKRESLGSFAGSSIADGSKVPDMWSWDYIGLYCQYAAVGLLYGTSSTCYSLCAYVYKGQPNLCANAPNISFFAWNFKIVFAIITDSYRPFGLRRKPWMIGGFLAALVLLVILAIFADTMSTEVWIVMLMLVQFAVMFSDVPADGYSVELGRLEPPNKRGTILATGQLIRFSFSVFAGMIQAFLLNGPTTNDSGCQIDFEDCWGWGLSINGYYGLCAALVFILFIPILWIKEVDPSTIPQHSFKHHISEIWDTLQNLTTFYLLIFVIGVGCFTNFISNANLYMQYYVIQLTNFEAGIDTITSYAALSVAIWLFKTYLINVNWRYTQIGSTVIASVLGLLWILVYYNVGGLRNPWFTIFIDLDQSFVNGLSQVLFSLSVIELSKPGLEATTYELIITVCNAATAVSGIIATQLLTPLNAAGCTDDDCPSDTVDINSNSGFDESNGPIRYTRYCLILIGVSIVCCLIFTQFLPKNKEQCHEWKLQGEKAGASKMIGYVSLSLTVITIGYGFAVAILLLLPETSCSVAVGGTGC